MATVDADGDYAFEVAVTVPRTAAGTGAVTATCTLLVTQTPISVQGDPLPGTDPAPVVATEPGEPSVSGRSLRGPPPAPMTVALVVVGVLVAAAAGLGLVGRRHPTRT